MAATNKNININMIGKGKAILRPSNYVTSGGEASIYRLNDIIVKVFTDPQKMSADKMVEKVSILAKLLNKYIINPLGVVEDEKNNPIGYYMNFAEFEPLSRVFTTAFRQREGFNDQDAIQLVHSMREVPIFAHANGAILVDANELNWGMKRETLPEPRVVDVDSWQIGQRWPARVIMPSIRDYQTKGFNEESDWFSWGIVSFQVFTGIHPYKGKHPSYKPGDLEQRMRDNVSVFDPEVRLNAAVRDFSTIPGRLLDWYQMVFQHGERSQPPSPLDARHATTIVRQVHALTATMTDALIYELLLPEAGNPVIRVWPCGVALRADGTLVELQGRVVIRQVSFDGKPLSAAAELVRTPRGYLVTENGRFKHVAVGHEKDLTLTANLYGIFRSANRLFGITDSGLTELVIREMASAGQSSNPLLTLGQSWQIMRLATEWFQEVGVQNALGAKYLVIPFGDNAVTSVRARELDDVTVVTAKGGHRFVSAIALAKSGDYKKFEFSFDKDYTKYSIWSGSCDTPELNLAILPSGVCATILNDGEIDIFVPQNGKVSKVADKTIATDMLLGTWQDRVVYIQNGALTWVKMK